MGNKVKASKKIAKEEGLIILRYKIIENIISEAEFGDYNWYVLKLRDSINKRIGNSGTSSEEEHNDKIEFYKNHDIYLWDLKRQKKDYRKLLNKRIFLGINLTIDNELVIEYGKKAKNILNINLESDFYNGLMFNYHEEEFLILKNIINKRAQI